MRRVVFFSQGFIHKHKFTRNDSNSTTLKAGNDLTSETALYCIWLDQNQGLFQ